MREDETDTNILRSVGTFFPCNQLAAEFFMETPFVNASVNFSERWKKVKAVFEALENINAQRKAKDGRLKVNMERLVQLNFLSTFNDFEIHLNIAK